MPVRAFAQQAVEARAHPAVETCGDPGIDPAFRRDQGIRAEPLDGRHGRQDDKPPAALLDEASHQVLSGSCRLGMLCQPGLHPAHVLALEHPVAVDPAQGDEVFTAGLFANRIWQQVVRLQAQLGRNEPRHVFRDHFARLQQSARKAKRAELQREAQLVLRPSSLPDVLDVIVRQRVVLQQGGLVRGQVEKAGALALGQNAASWQLGSLLVL